MLAWPERFVQYAHMASADFPIIEKLGGREAVVKRLKDAGQRRVTKSAARMWLARGRLPGHISTALMALADAEGVAYTGADFTAPPQDDSGESRAA